MEVDGEVGSGTGSARRWRERRLLMHWRHEHLSLRMALAAATHHSAQPRAQEELEGEKYYAPRRPKPPLPEKRLAPLEEVAEPQAKLGQHSGIGYELVLALDAPPVDVLVRVDELLKKQEEEVRGLLWKPKKQHTSLQQKKALEHFSTLVSWCPRCSHSELWTLFPCPVLRSSVDTFSYVCFGGFWSDPLHPAVICSVLGVTGEYKDYGFLGDDAMFPNFRNAWYDSGY